MFRVALARREEVRNSTPEALRGLAVGDCVRAYERT